MGRGLNILIILASLAAVSTWFLIAVQSSLQENPTQDEESPVLTIHGFHAIHLDESGYREYALTSSYVEQLPGEKGTTLEQPYVETYDKDQYQDWTMYAEQGWISHANDLIRLEQDVTINRPAVNAKLPVTITTRNLLIRPDEDIVETIEPVRVETPSGILNAIGLKSLINAKQLELLSTVRGSYDPPKP